MTAKFRFNLMSVTILAVLIVNAVWAAPALADDGTPPPAETPLETPTAPTEEPTAIAEQLQELPEGTEVVVLNEEGQVLPLASNETAQVIHNNDPMWCPAGVAPGGAGCTTPGQTSFNGLLTELSTYNSGAGPNKAGVIWIAGGYDSGTDDSGIFSFTLDGLTLTEMAKYALTFQGGWIGTMGSKLTNQLDPSEFNASLSILDWTGAITLNDILIDGATINPNTGSSGSSALIVQTAGSITLNRVQITNSGNGFNGADLDNSTSPTLAAVSVNESIFNNNEADGLRILSLGAITIRNLTANNNGTDDAGIEYGAFITNWLTIDANKPVTLSGMNQFKSNLGTGLFVSSFGAVTLNNITAHANDDVTDGSGGDGTGVIVQSSLSIKMTGTNLINFNQVHGLDLSSDGTISLNNINASNNGEGGAILDNCRNPTQYAACNFVGKAVTLTGTNIFNNNGFEGLVVQSGGNITISNITASGNGSNSAGVSSGVYLDNCVINGNTSSATCNNAVRAVSITTPATFLGNAADGLHIVSSGAITLKGLTANSNGDQGVYIDNRGTLSKPQSITLSGTNTINGNDNIGLIIYSYGKVSLNNVTANNNGQADSSGMGVYIDNRALSASPVGSILVTRQPVTFTGNNTFNGNYGGGLYLWSVGDVTLSNITAIGNGLTSASDGVHIENEVAWYPNGVSQSAYAARVTLNGFGIFQGNGDEGLQIFSRGAIKFNNVTANDNLDVGVWVNNSYITTMSTRQPITLTGINNFNNNDGGGLMLLSFGNITLSNITASGNIGTGGTGGTENGDGVYINNDQTWSPNGVPTSYAASVTISGFGYFEDNAENGLDIQSRGVVTLATITANDNADDGVYIFNVGDLAPQNVTISGVNNFYSNGGDGLFVQSDGKITISNLTAIENTGNGAWLDNFTSAKLNKFMGVTLTGVSAFQLNQGANGLRINSDGAVTMSNVNADDNTGNGIQVFATKNLTLMCVDAYSNTGTGLLLTTDVAALMTLKGVHGYGNGTDENLTYGIGKLVRTWNCP